MSQEELAHAAGRSVHAISQLERGVNTPSLETLIALADIFKCSLDNLAGRSFAHSSKDDERHDLEQSILNQINGMDIRGLQAVKTALKALSLARQ